MRRGAFLLRLRKKHNMWHKLNGKVRKRSVIFDHKGGGKVGGRGRTKVPWKIDLGAILHWLVSSHPPETSSLIAALIVVITRSSGCTYTDALGF